MVRDEDHYECNNNVFVLYIYCSKVIQQPLDLCTPVPALKEWTLSSQVWVQRVFMWNL